MASRLDAGLLVDRTRETGVQEVVGIVAVEMIQLHLVPRQSH